MKIENGNEIAKTWKGLVNLIPNRFFVFAFLFLLYSVLNTAFVLADDCAAIGGSIVSGECQLSTTFTSTGTFSFDETLHILGTGEIDATGGGVTLNIDGDLIMDTSALIEANDPFMTNNGASTVTIDATGSLDMKSGSDILAENNFLGGSGAKITIEVDGDFTSDGEISSSRTTSLGSGTGGDIEITVGGNMELKDDSEIKSNNVNGNAGDITIDVSGNMILRGGSSALISSDKTSTSGSGSGGKIEINTDGTFEMEPGTKVSSGSEEQAGDIEITAGDVVEIDGLVAAGPGNPTINSYSTRISALGEVLSGVASSNQKGGKITIKSTKSTASSNACLIVSTDGIIIAQGLDPGAGKVTLEACGIEINGLVGSVGKRDSDNVLILRSGTFIKVNGQDLGNSNFALFPRQGRLRGDVTDDGSSIQRVELFAEDDIEVYGPSSGTPVVSSLGGTATNQKHGTIRMISLDGKITVRGILDAGGNFAGGIKGGEIELLAKNDVDVDTVTMSAEGDFIPTTADGGDIEIRSYSGKITWKNGVGDVRPTGTGETNVGKRGTIDLTACTTVDTTGSSFPVAPAGTPTTPTILTSVCSPTAPSLPGGQSTLPQCIPLVQCGDGTVNGNEQCDDGNQNNNDQCNNQCVLTICGDGAVQNPNSNNQQEQCDDGNTVDNDGCTNQCVLTICGDGAVQNPNSNSEQEQCDDGNTVDNDGCTNQCTLPICGDGIVNQQSEQCDDGNAVNDDGCSNSCILPVCGDGTINGGEQCDDGANNGLQCIPPYGGSCQYCSDECEPAELDGPFCGDGIKDVPYEMCDDGNDDNNDICRNDCTCIDKDDDKVCDKVDLCLGSLPGEIVDENGCDAFQFCGQVACGPRCESFDFLGDEPDEEFPLDCTTVIVLNEGTYYPKCVPLEPECRAP